MNGQTATLGQKVSDPDKVLLDSRAITPAVNTLTVMLNKPVGYVCSRNGQGSKTIYDLLPPGLHHLKPVGRLDKDSSGLLLLTNDGQRAYELTHPSFQKEKVYQVRLDKLPTSEHIQRLRKGVLLADGISKLDVRVMSYESRVMSKNKGSKTQSHNSLIMTHDSAYEVRLTEGRNRQIRRTFEALGYKVISLNRTNFGHYALKDLLPGKYTLLD